MPQPTDPVPPPPGPFPALRRSPRPQPVVAPERIGAAWRRGDRAAGEEGAVSTEGPERLRARGPADPCPPLTPAGVAQVLPPPLPHPPIGNPQPLWVDHPGRPDPWAIICVHQHPNAFHALRLSPAAAPVAPPPPPPFGLSPQILSGRCNPRVGPPVVFVGDPDDKPLLPSESAWVVRRLLRCGSVSIPLESSYLGCAGSPVYLPNPPGQPPGSLGGGEAANTAH